MLKFRDPRKSVSLKSRLHSDHGWTDVTIANVSTRGLMLVCESPPAKRSFIEVRHGSASIVGQVMWSEGPRCGVRTREPIDIPALLGQAPPRPRTGEDERRTPGRDAGTRSPAYRIIEQREASARWGVYMQWGAVAFAGIMGAVLLAGVVGSFLERSLDPVRSLLE